MKHHAAIVAYDYLDGTVKRRVMRDDQIYAG